MALSNRLRDLREEESKSQTEMAAFLNIHQTTLSKYENGTIDIPTEILCTLADYYKTSTDFILMRTSERNPHKE